MFARFNENPAMTLQDIKETKRYGRTDGWTDNVKTVYPLQTKFAGGIIIFYTMSLAYCVTSSPGKVSLVLPFNKPFASRPSKSIISVD